MTDHPAPPSRHTRYPGVIPRGGSRSILAKDASDTEALDQPVASQVVQVIRKNAVATLGVVFLASILLPIPIQVGPLLLFPYRILLLVLFFPLLFWLLSGRVGRLTLIDMLMAFSALWAALALLVNHPFAEAIEPLGIYIVEFFGAYMLGRLAVQSGADFLRFARALFAVLMLLLPFAVAEAISGKPVLMDLIPGATGVSDTGDRMGLRRTQTIFVHPILYGAFAASVLGVAWFTVRPQTSFGGRIIRAIAVIIATVTSMSTGALIALVCQIIFIGYETIMGAFRKRWTLFAWGSLAGYFLIDALSNRTPFHVLVSYASFNSGSAYNRILIWDHGTKNVADNPIFGLGMNDWVRPSWMSASIDNFWLVVAMRYGLPASIAFMAAVILMVRRIAHAELTDLTDRMARAGYLVSLGGLILAGGTVHYWQAIAVYFLFFIGAGMWMTNPDLILKPDQVRADNQAKTPPRG